jgi:flagellar biosynthetic protein FlhB
LEAKKRVINLQLFAEGAGDKTEKATPKRRREAREKGQVLQSREIASALILLCAFMALRLFGPFMFNTISGFSKKVFAGYGAIGNIFDINGIIKLFIETVTVIVLAMAPLLAVVVVSGIIAGYSQVGFLFTTKTLALKFDRLNPISGLKRIFSTRSIAELFKALFKVVIIGYISYSYLRSQEVHVMNLMSVDVLGAASFIGVTTTNLAIRICIALVILGALDYGYQWWEYEKNLRMSKQEIKEEYKQTEGNPEIKSKIKQKQRQISMRRMLMDVPKADVVITNPTHYAVSIKYNAEESEAPVVTAKGCDYMAFRIKSIAKENGVEIIENKALAINIYETVDIGEKIPPELYQAVAEVLAYVYGLKNQM